MILPNPGGKVGHRRTQIRITPHNCVGGDSIWPQLISNSQFWPHRVERHTWSRTDGAVATSAVQDAALMPAGQDVGRMINVRLRVRPVPIAPAVLSQNPKATPHATKARRFLRKSMPSSCHPKYAAS